MNTTLLLSVISAVCEFGVSAAPLAVTDPILSSGGKATSANYSDEATIGDIVGVSTGPSAGVNLKSGFIGQLYEARSLAVRAAPRRWWEWDDAAQRCGDGGRNDRGQAKRSIKRHWWQR